MKSFCNYFTIILGKLPKTVTASKKNGCDGCCRRQYQRHYCADTSDSFNNTNHTEWIKPISYYTTPINIYHPVKKINVQFASKESNFITWYVCGPTVYDSTHIGHACSYVRMDVIRRILEKYTKRKVVQAMCITDIDDKIFRRAKETNTDWKTMTESYEREFFADLKSIGVKRPAFIGRTSQFIPQTIAFTSRLLDKGFAYVAKDKSVYFNIKAYGRHGKLFALAAEIENKNLYEASRNYSAAFKESPADFALWKSAKEDEPYWNAPWGPGRPGWHLECSTIASGYFGDSIDIHSGGIDLVFPHHENEESQSCAFHGVQQWVNYWIHTGHITVKLEKMSKSLGNTISIRDYLRKNSANDLRMLCLSRNYRANVDFYDEGVEWSREMCAKIYQFFDDCDAYANKYTCRGDVDEVLLLQTLERTKTIIDGHLLNNFDTKSCLNELSNLMSITRSMLMADLGKRCISIVYLIKSYVEDVVGTLGFNFSEKSLSEIDVKKCFSNLDNIIDNSVLFRDRVRTNAISLMKNDQNSTTGRQLLQLCDNLRKEFSQNGVQIKDYKQNSSSWSYIAPKTISNEQTD